MPDDSLWPRAKQILNDLLEAAPDDPDAWLEERCEGESVLRNEVERLLRAYDEGVLSEGDEGTDWIDDPVLETGGLRGRRVGPYRLEEEIGLGGMSVVYRAERADGAFEQTVAVKLLQRRLHADGAEQRFRAERQVLASLDHPNIAGLIDGGVTDGGRSYLVMEYVEGVPLTEYARAHDLRLGARLDLLDHVVEAVQAAHRQLVVHRDLKPGNVLVADGEEGPSVTLLDFGIAKLLDETLPVDRPRTHTGLRPMTPSYAAPEQVRGEKVTTATDVYQLGALAYELLSGARPYALSDPSPSDLEEAVLETSPPPASTRTGDGGCSPEALRGDLDVILKKALRKEPDRRYASAEAFGADLRRHRRGEPVEAQSTTLGYRTRKFVQRRSRAVVGTLAVLVVLIGSGLYHTWRLSAERNQAQREAEKAEQVSQFLAGLFREADPSRATGDTITARDLLRKGTEQIGDLEDQPAVQAELMHVIGSTRRSLALYDTTRTLLEKALETRRELHGARHPDVAETLNQLALVERDQNGAHAVAESLLTRAVSIRRSTRPTDTTALARSLKNLVYVRRRQGKGEAAEEAVREALSLQRAVYGDEHIDVAESLFNLAAVLRDQGHYQEAERVQRRSLALARTLTDGPHPGVATNLSNLALTLKEQDKHEAAEDMYRRALDQNRKLYDSAHPGIANTLNNLHVVLKEQGRSEAAESYLRRALRMQRDLYDEPHPRIANSLANLGTFLRDREQYPEANSAYRAARLMLEDVGQAQSPSMASMLENHGELFARREQYAKAESAYRRALDLEQTHHEPGHPERTTLREALVRLYDAWGKPERAAEYRISENEKAPE